MAKKKRNSEKQASAFKIDPSVYGKPIKTTLQNTDSTNERGFDNLDRRASLQKYEKELFPSYKLYSKDSV